MSNQKTSKHIKITALYERLSIGDERRGTEESNSIQNQKIQLEAYAKENGFTNIKHYTDDDESGRFFDRDGYSRMMEDVESGKIGIVIMKDLTRWGRDHIQVGLAMEIFRQNNVRFIAINHGIDSINPESLEMAPFINIMSEWFAKDTSKKIRSVFKAKGMAGKHTGSIPPYGYIKCSENKDLWIVDETAAAVVACCQVGKSSLFRCQHIM
jgi:DNA invertase Pin-like site-specific DNA recombinase